MRAHHLGALAVAAVLAIPTAAGAALPGTVVFMREDFANNANDLSIARADGTTGAVDLTRFQDHDPSVCLDGSCSSETPDWFPDGSRIYFTATWIPFVSIWSINPDATNPVQEPNVTDFDGAPAISGDGTLVAFDGSNADGSEAGIYIRPLGSLSATKLTSGPSNGFDSNPDIAPDNTRVVFTRFYENAAREEIWIVNTDGTGLRRLLSSGRRWGDPHFSPDGAKILVQAYDERANQGRNSNEYTMDANGASLRPLTNEPIGSFAFSGDWSPDGKHIAYMRFRRGDDHVTLRSMDANGNDESLIADCPLGLFCDNPSWGVYEGALPATANASIRSAHASRRMHRVSHRVAAKRLYQRVIRRLSR
jgi:Tol biopolymer transport system component